MPLAPTPPNGKSGTPVCITVSLILTPPEEVDRKICCCFGWLFEKKYKAKGLGWELTSAIASLKSLYSITGKIGPKISISSLHLPS